MSMTELENALRDFERIKKEFDARLRKLEEVMGLRKPPVLKPDLKQWQKTLKNQ